MSRPNNFVIKNSKNERCKWCGEPHEFLSRKTSDAPCDTPIAYSKEMAQKLAASPEDVVEAPHDTIVALDPSARKLPQNSAEVGSRLVRTSIGERTV